MEWPNANLAAKGSGYHVLIMAGRRFTRPDGGGLDDLKRADGRAVAHLRR